MSKLYRICDMIIECDFRYPTMQRRSEKFLLDENEAKNAEPDFSVIVSEEVLEKFNKKFDYLPADSCEIILTSGTFYRQLITRGGFMLHSSAVVKDGRAYLFSAPSGTGKSTHTSQWLKLFDDAYILNDDKPAILPKEKIYAAGTPWSGKSDLNTNDVVPLQAICVIRRGEENTIERIGNGEAIPLILEQTIRPNIVEDYDELLGNLEKVLKDVPVYMLHCNISTDAAKLAYERMKENED